MILMCSGNRPCASILLIFMVVMPSKFNLRLVSYGSCMFASWLARQVIVGISIELLAFFEIFTETLALFGTLFC